MPKTSQVAPAPIARLATSGPLISKLKQLQDAKAVYEAQIKVNQPEADKAQSVLDQNGMLKNSIDQNLMAAAGANIRRRSILPSEQASPPSTPTISLPNTPDSDSQLPQYSPSPTSASALSLKKMLAQQTYDAIMKKKDGPGQPIFSSNKNTKRLAATVKQFSALSRATKMFNPRIAALSREVANAQKIVDKQKNLFNRVNLLAKDIAAETALINAKKIRLLMML